MPTTTISRCVPGPPEDGGPFEAEEVRPEGAPEGMVPDAEDGEGKWREIWGIHIEKAVLSTCSVVGCVLSRPSSAQVSPRRDLFCVVA